MTTMLPTEPVVSTDSAQTATAAIIDAQDVHKRFGALEVLKGITLQVERGQVACLLGPSGSGKSTFLRCINHLEKVDAGVIRVAGRTVGYEERNGKLYELPVAAVARQRRGSAWSSSGSTSSRT